MTIPSAVRLAVAISVCALCVGAALVSPAAAGSAGPTATASSVAGTLSTNVVINRFRAVGRRLVGQGTAVSKFTDATGKTSTTRKQFRVALRSVRRHFDQGQTVCQILFLQLGTLDLTLAGLHVVLKADDPTMPVQLTLTADDTGGVLGKLFCSLAQGKGLLSTPLKAATAAKTMTKRLAGTTILRAKATIYAPGQSNATGGAGTAAKTPLAAECPVLHLVLGPLHLNLLGLIADLNKVDLDLTAIPGTLLGNIFCQLTPPPTPAG
jgi:hypothetical protein